MFEFCPHCGQTINQKQIEGRMLVCADCGTDIGFVGTVKREAIDETAELIRSGMVARCPVCHQAVDGKNARLVPHYAAGTRKICPGSGKATGSAPAKPRSAGKDLSPFMTRDLIKLISCARTGEPRIEIVTLEYLDKGERVRIQIEALREMMGADFRMSDYPPSLHKPGLAVWMGTDACVIAKAHERGGYQSIADDQIAAVLSDLRDARPLFFGIH